MEKRKFPFTLADFGGQMLLWSQFEISRYFPSIMGNFSYYPRLKENVLNFETKYISVYCSLMQYQATTIINCCLISSVLSYKQENKTLNSHLRLNYVVELFLPNSSFRTSVGRITIFLLSML